MPATRAASSRQRQGGKHYRHRLAPLLALAAFVIPLTLAPAAPPPPPKFPNLKTYDSKYYVIHTDLPPDGAREAVVRMNRMADEYHARTRGFTGAIRGRLPFFLFRSEDDYITAGGVEGSWGLFDGEQLMAVATDTPGPDTWHVVQHEGFHQFAKAVIGGELPMWVNEGLAEYFGEAVFTGDDLVTGLVPQDRLDRIREMLREKSFVPFRGMLEMPRETWNANLALPNYDQAWAMIHFLAHADNGRYQRPFADMMTQLSRGQNPQAAFEATFKSADAFETAWKTYWQKLPDNPTADAYVRADVATVTSFLARATAANQRFENFDAFHAAARSNTLKIADPDWLPPTLLRRALRSTLEHGTWTLDTPPGRAPQLTFSRTEDRKRFTSAFTLHSGRVRSVAVTEPPPTSATSRTATTRATSRPVLAAPRSR